MDREDRVVGAVRRGDAHRDSTLIHRSVQVLIFDGSGRVLLQRRSAAKDLFPLFWCASASGHVAAGDSYDETAARELAEELGVHLDLTCRGKFLVASEQETEVTVLFTANSSGPFTFDPIETCGGEFFTRDDLSAMLAKGALKLTPATLAALDCAGWHEVICRDEKN